MSATYIALDLETTGFDPKKDKIIEVAAIKCDNEKIYDSFTTLINPQRSIPSVVTHLTGISEHEVSQAPEFSAIMPELKEFIGDLPITGHFISFDINFLEAQGLKLANQALDTCELTRALLPYESSYSLEVLGEKYQLTHNNKHRAHDDTQAAIQLLHLLFKTAKNLPEITKQKIRQILEKSHWHWKETLLTALSQPTSNEPVPAPLYPAPATCTPAPALKQTIAEKISQPGLHLIECPIYSLNDLIQACEPLLKNNHKKIIISRQQLDTINIGQIAENPEIAILKQPENYLCLSKMAQISQKPQLDDHETAFLIKMCIWLDSTQTGDRFELKLRGEEETIWQQISASAQDYQNYNNENCFFNRALEKAKNAGIIITDHHFLLVSRVSSQVALPSDAPLIIEQAVELENSIKRSLRVKLNQYHLENLEKNASSSDPEKNLEKNSFIEKLQILFGLLGMLLEKNYDPSGYGKYMVITPAMLSTPEGHNFQQSIKHLIELHHPDLSQELHKMAAALENPTKNFIQLYEDHNQHLHLSSVPANLDEQLRIHLWEKTKTAILITPYAKTPPENTPYNFIKKRLGLPNSASITDLTSASRKRTITIVEDMIANGKNGHFQKLAQLSSNLAKNLSGCFFIHTSKKGIDSLHSDIANELKENNRILLSQGVSGGTGKIAHIYHGNQENTILIGKENMLEELINHKEFPITSLKHLFIINLPFDVPTDGWYQSQTQNMAAEFQSYTLPRVALALQSMITNFFESQQDAKSVTILDPRLITSEYGVVLQNTLAKNYDIVSVNENHLIENLK